MRSNIFDHVPAVVQRRSTDDRILPGDQRILSGDHPVRRDLGLHVVSGKRTAQLRDTCRGRGPVAAVPVLEGIPRLADKIHDKQLRRCAVQLQYSGTGILGSFRHGHTDIGVLPEPGGQQAHNTQDQKGLKKPEPYRQAERVQDEMKKKAGIAAAIIPVVVVAAALVYNRQMSELNR